VSLLDDYLSAERLLFVTNLVCWLCGVRYVADGLQGVSAAGGPPRMLRPGPIDLGLDPALAGNVEAPGQLASHYAPTKPLRLNTGAAEPGEWLIGFGPVTGDASLSSSGNLVEAAAKLFDLLHEADAASAPRIAVAPIPEEGLGVAINDRLRRAAAPRVEAADVG
jgi:L-threonylcarbamoyladenylate synthase